MDADSEESDADFLTTGPVEGYSSDEVDSHVHEKGTFFGCYLLVSRNPKFKGRTYIGYTVNPNRRIKQHNKGKQGGGALRTSGRGPWDMVLIVHGFPNDISALRFEWAWQHPDKSRRLDVARKGKGESSFIYRFRVLTEMLRTGPWNRLPLTIRWLQHEYMVDFPPSGQPPTHMAIAYGLVNLQTKRQQDKAVAENELEPEKVVGSPPSEDSIACCCVCAQSIERKDSQYVVKCYHKPCEMSAHILCLAKQFCEPGMLLPVEGRCLQCGKDLLWGELVKRLKSGKDVQ